MRSASVDSAAWVADSACVVPIPARAATSAKRSSAAARRIRRPGHHAASPNSEVNAGTSSDRTMKVSTSTPAVITNANSRKERSGTIASSANEAASASPAAVTARAAAGIATAIASRRR